MTEMRGVLRKLTGCPNCTLAAVGIFFAGAIAVLFLFDLHSRYVDAIAVAKQTARNYAEVLAEHTAHTFMSADRSLRVAETVRRNAEAGPYASPAEQIAATRKAHEALEQLQKTSPMMVAIGWTNAAGDVLMTSTGGRPSARSFRRSNVVPVFRSFSPWHEAQFSS